ncbi:hypothetical protein R1sor_016808 [Riccia sorocarpa]|uniref:Uncharacterized protein n=1 Tax=Riccia sorocarpa TaxID=122646 RepID=A0ABD3HMA6_9MARC
MKISTLYPKLKHDVLNLRKRIINALAEGLQVQSLSVQLEQAQKEMEHLRSTSMTNDLMVDYEQTMDTVTRLQREIQQLQGDNLVLQTEIRQRKLAEYKFRREAGPGNTGTTSYPTPSTIAGSEGVGRRDSGGRGVSPSGVSTTPALRPPVHSSAVRQQPVSRSSSGTGVPQTGQPRPGSSGVINSAKVVEENVVQQTEALPPPPPLPASRPRSSTPEPRGGVNPSR